MKLAAAVVILFVLASQAEGVTHRMRITPAQCQQIRNAIAVFGLPFVEAQAAARGYTRAQVRYAKAYCK